MGSHVKTNEEYKIFKGRKKSMIADWDVTDSPDNKRDPKEPFLNRNKPAYLSKKRDNEVLDLLNIPQDAWDSFINGIKTRFKNFYEEDNTQLWSERGTRGVNKDSYFYYITLDYFDSGEDSKIYFFPKEQKIVVKYRNYPDKKADKKIFEYTPDTIRVVLSDVLAYLFTKKKDPKEIENEYRREDDLAKQRRYKDLLYTDDELEEPEEDEQRTPGVEIPSHRQVDSNAQDTATFDSLKHVKSFKVYEGKNKDVKANKITCHVCGEKFDPHRYEQHHKKCKPKNNK